MSLSEAKEQIDSVMYLDAAEEFLFMPQSCTTASDCHTVYIYIYYTHRVDFNM